MSRRLFDSITSLLWLTRYELCAEKQFRPLNPFFFFDDCRWVPMNYHGNKKILTSAHMNVIFHMTYYLAHNHSTKTPGLLTPPMGRFCRHGQPLETLGDPKLSADRHWHSVYTPSPPLPRRWDDFADSADLSSLWRAWGSLKCRQIGTRTSTIEKRGSMGRIAKKGVFKARVGDQLVFSMMLSNLRVLLTISQQSLSGHKW